jgi:hypothetical protein
LLSFLQQNHAITAGICDNSGGHPRGIQQFSTFLVQVRPWFGAFPEGGDELAQLSQNSLQATIHHA